MSYKYMIMDAPYRSFGKYELEFDVDSEWELYKVIQDQHRKYIVFRKEVEEDWRVS